MRAMAIVLIATAAFCPPVVFGQIPGSLEDSGVTQACDGYLGQTVSTRPFEAITSLVSGGAIQKDEFETTASYEARRTKAAANVPAKFIVEYVPDRKYLRYEADSGTLNVSAYFFRNRNTDYEAVFRQTATSPDGGSTYGRAYDNIDVVVGEEERVVDSYTGSNSYGGQVQVSKIQRDTSAIWDRAAQSGEHLFPTQSKEVGADIGAIAMSADEAKAIKDIASAALVIAPKFPYFAYGNKKWDPRFDRPTHVNNDIFVVVADIQCALLLDAGNKVRGVWVTR